MVSKRGATPGLFEFLQEAHLSQYYNGLRNNLRVYHVQQLKYVGEDDCYSIGMAHSEVRRLRVCFHKYCPQNYASKLKRLLLSSWAKDEFLLDEANEDMSQVEPNSGVKVPKQHIISPDAVKICKELGAGEFGIVEQGVLKLGHRTHQVAIKSLSKERMQNSIIEFMKEYEIMQSIEHTNIVRLFGVVLHSNRIMLITELAPLRSLLECLKETSLRPTMTVSCLSRFGMQICAGMQYLESQRLIHRDLAARNILVFSKNLVKVSDFGLSRALGVGKDYYQTNFNANLKLPIAWCAPECITFLKFTSASDVWAFGVTLWEMFSYGFQPWAALTGQQILAAIDEPKCQRLEQPLHCPKEMYSIMLQCWHHDPLMRPTFAQLAAIVRDAHPEQVQAVAAPPSSLQSPDFLHFEVGSVITVLDKQPAHGKANPSLWSGVNDQSNAVGLFCPSETVAYVNSLPSNNRWSQESPPSVFQRGSSRSLSRKKIHRDMISSPSGELQHTGHLGLNGSHFGNVSQLFDFKAPYMSMPCLSGPSSHLSSANDLSESAPLLKKSVLPAGNKNHDASSRLSKNPRLGYTIGYLRSRAGTAGHSFLGDSTSGNAAFNSGEVTRHEYQSISDEEDDFLSKPPLDLGPSFLDEVLSELDGAAGPAEEVESGGHVSGAGEATTVIPVDDHKRSSDLKELMSSLTLSKKQRRKFATVKPIKASDEKTLENAIAMANALASKSMHDLDKRSGDHFYDHSPPAVSPATPNSPSKKFHFWFPSSSKSERKPFTEEMSVHCSLENSLSAEERNVYRALIESSASQTASTCPLDMDQGDHDSNPLPLPPKTASLTLSSNPKRHVRKNPLIVPSSMVSGLMSRNESIGLAATKFNFQTPPMSKRRSRREPPTMCVVAPFTQTAAHDHVNHAFEEAIASQIDALDDISDDPHQGTLGLGDDDPPGSCKEEDEVRIMSKVIGRALDRSISRAALDLTGWDVHHAIQVAKLYCLVNEQWGVQLDLSCKQETVDMLEQNDWDVSKAVKHMAKLIQRKRTSS